MLFRVQDWLFDVDVDATVAYSEHLYSEHCECGYCRNYYATVDSKYPALKPFFSQFGVHVEGPVDFLPVEPTLCIVSYALCGTIVEEGREFVEMNGFSLTVQRQEQLDYTLSCQQPYFVLTTGYLELPWVLDEDMDEVVSPANEPACLERMYRKLLGEAATDGIQS